jgi:hypothetical protein
MNTGIAVELNALHNRLIGAIAGRNWEAIPALLNEQKRFIESNLKDLSPDIRKEILQQTGKELLLAQTTRAQTQDALNRNSVSLAILSAYYDCGHRQTFTSLG